MEQFIKEFYQKSHEILIIKVEYIEDIVNQIENYDMLFRIADDNLMLVLTKIPDNINSFNENNKNYVVIKNYLICCMRSDSSGFKILTPYKYECTYSKYFRKACCELNIENNEQNKDKIIEHTKKNNNKRNIN